MREVANLPSLFARQPAALPNHPAREGEVIHQQAALQTRGADISLTTAEGDRVTLSQSFASMQTAGYRAISDGNGQQRQMQASTMRIDTFSLAVEGELNDQELADIKALINDLSDIGRDFFKGQTDKALDGALALGDTGTIREFSATFSYTSAVAVRHMESHPIPALDRETMQSFPKPEAQETDPAAELPAFAEIMQARWQEIWQLLTDIKPADEEAPAPRPSNDPPPDVTTTAQAMMDRAAATIAEHPALAPLVEPMAHRVIANQQAANPGTAGQANRLANEFSRTFANWLQAV